MVSYVKNPARNRHAMLERIKQGQAPARLPVGAPERRATHNANAL